MHIFDISFFGIQIAPTWYGLMYVLGFIFCSFFVTKYSKISPKTRDDLTLWIFLGVLVGGRLGYVLLYQPLYFLQNPLEIFAVWKGGMSFHGGFLGVLISVYIYQKIQKKSFFELMDILAICSPIALGLGRIGNYINKELLGYTPYDGPFAIMLRGKSHFPSPLLEMLLEGILLFTILYGLFLFLKKQYIGTGFWSGLFLIGYGLARIASEFFRLPDTHIGYLLGTNWLTLGMIYTLPFLFFGCGLLIVAHGAMTRVSLRPGKR